MRISGDGNGQGDSLMSGTWRDVEGLAVTGQNEVMPSVEQVRIFCLKHACEGGVL